MKTKEVVAKLKIKDVSHLTSLKDFLTLDKQTKHNVISFLISEKLKDIKKCDGEIAKMKVHYELLKSSLTSLETIKKYI